MAVSITQQPAYATPSDNPIIFQFKQTISGKFNMSFVIEVIVEGSVGTYEVYPQDEDATYVYGKYDVSNIVAPYIPTQNLKPINSATIFDPDGYRFISVNVYEKYSTTINGAVSVNPTPASSSQIGVFKGKLSRTEFLNWDYTDYQKGLTKQLLTDRSYMLYYSTINLYEQTIKKEDSLTYTWIDNTTIDTPVNYKVRYTYYNEATIIKQTDENFTTGNQGLLGSIYFNLDQHVSLGYLTSGEAASCTSVIIGLLNSSNVNIASITTVKFDNTCFYNGATLRFMNKYGAYDNYLFTYNKRYSASVKSFEFERSQGSWSNGVYSLSKANTGRLSYLKQTTKKLQLISDWLDETTQNWLTQLYDSPAVYINEGEENESVIITNSSYQIKQDKHDELFNEIVEIEFTPENSIRL
jgi:hypothetical protein